MVVKSNSVSTERELEPVRWERIDKIKSLIKGKKIPVSDDNVDFVLKLLKGFSRPWFQTPKSLDEVSFKSFQIWYSFLEDKIILIEGERLDDVQHQDVLNKDILFLGIFNLNHSRRSKKLKDCYSLVEVESEVPGKTKETLELTDEDLAKKFIVEYLKNRVSEKLKLVCKQLVLKDETFGSSVDLGSDGLLTSPTRDIKFIFNTPLSLLKKSEREWMYDYLFFNTRDPLSSTSNYDGGIKVIEFEYWDYLTTFRDEFNQYLSDIKSDIIDMFVYPDRYIDRKTITSSSKLLELLCNWCRRYFFTEEAGVFSLKDSKVHCESLLCEKSKYYHNQISINELLKEIAQLSFDNDPSNVILGLVNITGELSGGQFMSSVMSNLKLSSSFFFSPSTKGNFIKLLFSLLLESSIEDFNKKELESIVYDFENNLAIGKISRNSTFLCDGYNRKLILEELDSFAEKKSLNKLEELALDVNLRYDLTTERQSLTFGHSQVDLTILKSIADNIPVKISGALLIKVDFETILKLLLDETDFNYESAYNRLKIIEEIRKNNPEKVFVVIKNLIEDSSDDIFFKQIEHLKGGIEAGLYSEFRNSNFLLDFIKLILDLKKN